MGVSAFFRWLSEKFPKAVGEVLEQRCAVVNGVGIPVNLSSPNPNCTEYDNLYVDMNGLIHPCSHPEDRETPSTEAEMYVNVTRYVDRLFAAVRPRKCLFLAIDGVAPRAKMNQQRSRRFRAAQEAAERGKMMDELLIEMQDKGMDAPPGHTGEWDSNVITPGTDFMSRLSAYLWFYILDRMNSNEAWRSIKVILSDASEPGEGEHKIMKYVRDQRSQPGYDPNQSHVLHGLDADLIMLALATHELHFNILREKVFFGKREKESKQGQITQAQQLLDAQTKAAFNKGAVLASCLNPRDEWIYSKSLEILEVSVLREYLEYEFKDLEPVVPFGYDFERVVDDFIFMCFFVGNDFLPHLPSLDIRDGALDYLMEVYRDILPSLGNYLTSSGGNLNLAQVDILLARVGEVEDDVFQRRKRAEDYRAGGQQNLRLQNERAGFNPKALSGAAKSADQSKKLLRFEPTLSHMVPLSRHKETMSLETIHAQTQATDCATPAMSGNLSAEDNKKAAADLKGILKKRKNPASAPNSTSDGKSCTHEEDEEQKSAAKGTSTVKTSKRAKKEDKKDTAAQAKKKKRKEKEEKEKEEEEKEKEEEEKEKEKEKEKEDQLMDSDEEYEFEGDRGDVLPSATVKSLLTKLTAQESADLEKHKKDLAERLQQRVEQNKHSKIETIKEYVSDEIKFHEQGWKARYYDDTFKKEDVEKGGGKQHMCHTYVQGLVWVLKYYFEGCPSWNWYYPFHYAPFASDLRNIEEYPIEPAMVMSTPFRPVEQLLAVLPKESVHALPKGCQELMIKKSSPIEDLYDGDVPLDPNGKTLPWLWVLLLPFVDERRINAAFRSVVNNLTLEERRRNAWGKPLVFVHHQHKLTETLAAAVPYTSGPETDEEVIKALKYEAKQMQRRSAEAAGELVDTDEEDEKEPAAAEVPLSATLSYEAGNDFSGTVTQAPPNFHCPLNKPVKAPAKPEHSFEDIESNSVRVFTYAFPSGLMHESKLLPGGVAPQRKLTQADVSTRRQPRLNKGGANIVDLAQKFRRKDQISIAPSRGISAQGAAGYNPNLQQYQQQHALHQQTIATHHAQQQQYQSMQLQHNQQLQHQQQFEMYQQYQQQQVQGYNVPRSQGGAAFQHAYDPRLTVQTRVPPPGGARGFAHGQLGTTYGSHGQGQSWQQQHTMQQLPPPPRGGIGQQQARPVSRQPPQNAPRGAPAAPSFSHSQYNSVPFTAPLPPGSGTRAYLEHTLAASYTQPHMTVYGAPTGSSGNILYAPSSALPPPPAPTYTSSAGATGGGGGMLSIASMRDSLARTLNKKNSSA